MYCSNCGTKLNENGRFCPVCGTDNGRPDPAVQAVPYVVPPQIPTLNRELLTFNLTVHILTIIAFFTYAFIFGAVGTFVSFIGLFAKDAFAPGSVMVFLAGLLGVTAIITIVMISDKKLLYTDVTHHLIRETVLFSIAAAIFFILIVLSVFSCDLDIPKAIDTFEWHELIMLLGVVINVIAAVVNRKNMRKKEEV